MARRSTLFGLRLGLLAAGFAGLGQPAAAAGPATATADPRELALWVVESGDADQLPFLIVDKVGARIFAFGPDGAARGDASVLLGVARGDISPDGIGTRRLADIPPSDRITPAGRFEATRGLNIDGKDILWLDYEAALSLHSVVTGNEAEQRLRRLTTPSALDNRISYGCINVPASFYKDVVRTLFAEGVGIVYILPESPASSAMAASVRSGGNTLSR